MSDSRNVLRADCRRASSSSDSHTGTTASAARMATPSQPIMIAANSPSQRNLSTIWRDMQESMSYTYGSRRQRRSHQAMNTDSSTACTTS